MLKRTRWSGMPPERMKRLRGTPVAVAVYNMKRPPVALARIKISAWMTSCIIVRHAMR